MNPDIPSNFAEQFFLSTPCQATKTSWLVVPGWYHHTLEKSGK